MLECSLVIIIGSAVSVQNIIINMKTSIISLLLPAMALCIAPPHYGPQLYCRYTNTSVYAEVCVPDFTSESSTKEFQVKNVVNDDYCYDQIRTVCEETTKIVEREICTYNYEKKSEKSAATTTQVTYDKKSETMKVTSCGPSGYGNPSHYNYGEHQYCREEYQTQSFSIPLVNVPLEVTVEVSVPEPKKICVTKSLEISEVVCKDVQEKKCFNVAKFENSVDSVEEVKTVLGGPKCDHITLTLPTQACSKSGYGH